MFSNWKNLYWNTALIVFTFYFFCSFIYAENITLFPIKQNGKYGYIDQQGKIVISPRYNHVSDFIDGLALVMKDEEASIVDTTGHENFKADVVDKTNLIYGFSEFSEGYAVIKAMNKFSTNNKIYFINTKGKWVFGKNFEDALSFSCGLAAVKKNGKWGYINREGKLIIKCIFDLAEPFSEGFAHILINQKWGLIDVNGKYLIKPMYSGTAFRFSEGLALVSSECKKWKFIDSHGKQIIDGEFEMGYVFTEGLARVIVNKKAGYIDKKGQFVIQPQFDDAVEFSEGMAGVKIDGKWGFIDRSGTVIVQPQYTQVDYFKNGLASVQLDTKFGYIDKSGHYVWEPTE